ncbi:MAG: hypothetical protein ACP5P3_06585 [Ignavibacteria bacterium]
MLRKFFNEGGEFSMMRLMAFVTVLTGISVAVVIVVLSLVKFEIVYIREMIGLVGILLSIGFGGKTLQKIFENSSGESK